MYDMSPQHIRDVWRSVEDTRPALRMREIRFMYNNSLFKHKYIRFQDESSNAYCAVPAGDLVKMCFYSRFFGIDDSFDTDTEGWGVQIEDTIIKTGSGADTIMFLTMNACVSGNYNMTSCWGTDIKVIHPLCRRSVATWDDLKPQCDSKDSEKNADGFDKDIVSWLMED